MASDVVDGGVGGITNTQNPLTPTSMGGEYEYTRPNQTEQNQYKILYVSLTCECLTYLIALFYLVDSERMRLLDFDSAWLDFEELFFFDWTLLETNAVAVHQITNRYCLHLCTKICVIFQTFLSFLSLKMEEWNGFVFKKKKKIKLISKWQFAFVSCNKICHDSFYAIAVRIYIRFVTREKNAKVDQKWNKIRITLGRGQ